MRFRLLFFVLIGFVNWNLSAQSLIQFGTNDQAKIIEADLTNVSSSGILISSEGEAFSFSSNEPKQELKGRVVVDVEGDYAVLDDNSLICFQGDCFDFPGIVEDVKDVESNAFGTVVLMNDGTIQAWGDTLIKNTPENLNNIKEISMEGKTVSVLTNLGDVVSWGERAPFMSGAVTDKLLSIVAGPGFIMGLKEDNTIRFYGDTMMLLDNYDYRSLTNIVEIGFGAGLCGALNEQGELFVWAEYGPIGMQEGEMSKGVNDFTVTPDGELLFLRDHSVVKSTGYESYVRAFTSNPLNEIVKISPSLFQSIVVFNDGTIEVIGEYPHDSSPYRSINLSGVIDVAPDYHTIAPTDPEFKALTGSGEIYTWRYGSSIPQLRATNGKELVDYDGFYINNEGFLQGLWGGVYDGFGKVRKVLSYFDSYLVLRTNGTIVFEDPMNFENPTIEPAYDDVLDIALVENDFVVLRSNGTIEKFRGEMTPSSSSVNIPANLDGAVALYGNDKSCFVQFDNGLVSYYGDGKYIGNGFTSDLVFDEMNFGYNCTYVYSSLSVDRRGYQRVYGKISLDEMPYSCTEEGEGIVANQFIKSVDNKYWGMTRRDGTYTMWVDSSYIDNIVIGPVINQSDKHLYTKACDTIVNLNEVPRGDTMRVDFINQARYCTKMIVNVSSLPRERCFRSKTFVEYGNSGKEDAQNVEIRVEFPEYIIPISSSHPWDKTEGNTLIYNIGELAAQEFGRIEILDSVACQSVEQLGLTQCVHVEITPVSSCREIAASYDGSEVEVDAECNDGVVSVNVSNVKSKRMERVVDSRIYMNDTLIFMESIQLDATTIQPFDVPALGNTIRIEVDQVEDFPEESNPVVVVEGCVSEVGPHSIVKNHVTTRYQDDAEPEKAVSCSEIIGSYDPNDKLALPVGLTEKHYIKAGRKIDYTIRFQNTGTASARKVVVIDTLDSNLDMSTFVEGVGSHDYVLDVSGEGNPVLKFTFWNINLPDSTTDLLGSNGFVSFSISTSRVVPDETIISNKAEIYFDYNEPIITNLVEHTIGEPIVEDFSKGDIVVAKSQVLVGDVKVEESKVHLFPNPSSDRVRVIGVDHALITVSDMSGRELINTVIDSEGVSVQGLDAGLYLYEIMQEGEVVKQGKFVKR